MRRGVRKRGLSPVVASVLMILLVIVLAVIIFLWARGFIGERIEKFGKPIEEICGEVNFDVFRDGSELEIINRGNVDIRHLDIKLFDTRGNSEVNKFNIPIDAGETAGGHVTLEMDSGTPDKIIVYPVLVGTMPGKGENNVFTCMNSGVTI